MLQIENRFNVIFIHPSNYVEKILNCFNIDKDHPLSTQWCAVFDPKNGLFYLKEDDEKALDLAVTYLNVAGALTYLD